MKARIAECERLLQDSKGNSRRPSRDFSGHLLPQRFDSGRLVPKPAPSPSPPLSDAPPMGHLGSDSNRLTASNRRRQSIEILLGKDEHDVTRLISGMSVGSEASSDRQNKCVPLRQMRLASQDSAGMQMSTDEPEEFKRDMMG